MTLGGEEMGAEVLPAFIHRVGWQGDEPRGEHIPGQPSEWTRAASLSFLGTSPHDVRPHLLALMRWEQRDALGPCLAYGERYLSVWCQRHKQRPRQAVIEAATVDALALVFWGRFKRPMRTIEERRVELSVDKARFAAYRDLMVRTYKRRLSEAARLFLQGYERAGRGADYQGSGFPDYGCWLNQHAEPGPIRQIMSAVAYPQTAIIESRQKPTAIDFLASRPRAA